MWGGGDRQPPPALTLWAVPVAFSPPAPASCQVRPCNTRGSWTEGRGEARSRSSFRGVFWTVSPALPKGTSLPALCIYPDRGWQGLTRTGTASRRKRIKTGLASPGCPARPSGSVRAARTPTEQSPRSANRQPKTASELRAACVSPYKRTQRQQHAYPKGWLEST